MNALIRDESEIRNKIKELNEYLIDASLEESFDIREQIRLLEWVLGIEQRSH